MQSGRRHDLIARSKRKRLLDNQLKEQWKASKEAVNGWLGIPSGNASHNCRSSRATPRALILAFLSLEGDGIRTDNRAVERQGYTRQCREPCFFSTEATKLHLSGSKPARPNLSMTMEKVEIIAASCAATVE
jgi:hypothetical protein